VAGLGQLVEMVVILHDTTFSADTMLQLTCTDGLSLSGDAVTDGGRLALTDADSGKHELRVIISAFAMFTDTSDSSSCHEVTLLTLSNICVTVYYGMGMQASIFDACSKPR